MNALRRWKLPRQFIPDWLQKFLSPACSPGRLLARVSALILSCENRDCWVRDGTAGAVDAPVPYGYDDRRTVTGL